GWVSSGGGRGKGRGRGGKGAGTAPTYWGPSRAGRRRFRRFRLRRARGRRPRLGRGSVLAQFHLQLQPQPRGRAVGLRGGAGREKPEVARGLVIGVLTVDGKVVGCVQGGAATLGQLDLAAAGADGLQRNAHPDLDPGTGAPGALIDLRERRRRAGAGELATVPVF